MKQIGNIADTQVANPVLNSSGAVAGNKINATGYKRARFVFNLGTPLAGASFNASIWQAATSGATFAAIASASLAQITSGASSCVAVIDVPTSSGTPWLYCSAAVANSNYPVGVTVDLYQGMNRVAAPTGVQQIVTV